MFKDLLEKFDSLEAANAEELRKLQSEQNQSYAKYITWFLNIGLSRILNQSVDAVELIHCEVSGKLDCAFHLSSKVLGDKSRTVFLETAQALRDHKNAKEIQDLLTANGFYDFDMSFIYTNFDDDPSAGVFIFHFSVDK